MRKRLLAQHTGKYFASFLMLFYYYHYDETIWINFIVQSLEGKDENSIIRSFQLSKIASFRTAVYCMMIFTSVYGVVDGFFVSNFVGKHLLLPAILLCRF